VARSLLFSPLTLRGLTLRNRAWVSPMCQFSSEGGLVRPWHLVHLGARAAGGAGLVMTESTAVVPEGRITPQCLGLWSDEHVAGFRELAGFVREQGAVAAVQLAHAGRKASTWSELLDRPGSVPVDEGGWPTVGPSPSAYGDLAAPRALGREEIPEVVEAFVAATRRAHQAGFEVVELHGAHGYLLHSFLSARSNQRTDEYGGSLRNRARLLLEVTEAVRAAWPDELPLLVRLSATDYLPGGLTVADTAEVSTWLAAAGVDLVDVSTGGLEPTSHPETSRPGYQLAAAREVRERSGLPVSAVGMIGEAWQAEQVLAEGAADAVMLGRAFLRDPAWAINAARTLGEPDALWPAQYARAYRRVG
jgi:2,4-dienoyl-CoA reductase-like NADH-dependent reductase (Old Yellow Enzyme family)